MLARFRSWWKNTSKTLDAVIIGSLVILLVLVVLIILGYIFNWSWTGLHGRTLYDWLQLLIIPVVLAMGGYLFNYTITRNEQKANEQRAQTEREAAEKQAQTERDVALDNQREAALQGYIDNMSELLLEKKLRESGENDEVQTLARVRTLTVLPRLDGRRKASVVQFLYESGLIHKDKKIIDLKGADLMEAYVVGATLVGADLSVANLHRATLAFTNLSFTNLSRAYMVGANLSFTNLSGANLSRAFMEGAWLRSADLDGADLGGAKVTDKQLAEAASLKGATMPDGKIHAYMLPR